MTSPYVATLASEPRSLKASQPVTLTLRIVAPDGAPVTQFEKVHTEDMHLVLVSSDLEDFQHIHPQFQRDGSLRTEARLERTQPYAVFAEFEPRGGHEELARARLVPEDGRAVTPHLESAGAFDGSKSIKTVIDDTHVSLRLDGSSGKRIRAGEPTRLLVQIRDANGLPTRLEEWLGMLGHAIVLSPDLATFMHIHAMPANAGHGGGHAHHDHGHADHGAPPSTDTSDLALEVTFPSAGLYKAFFQFQRDGKVLTAPFVVAAA